MIMKDLESDIQVPGRGAQHGLRHVLRNFSPQWFTLTMGTGITGLLLAQFPYDASWLYWLAVVAFFLHLVLVCAFTFLSVLRFILYPDIWSATLRHPVESCFFGAFPVSILSLANLISTLPPSSWGTWPLLTAWSLWIIASAISLITALLIPWLHIRYLPTHPSAPHAALASLTGVYLLPPISTIVAALTAASVAQPLTSSPGKAAGTVLAGYVLLGLGLATSLTLLALYLGRLLLWGLPGREMVVSGFIAVGPLNMGAAACVMLGVVARGTWGEVGDVSEMAGEVVYAGGLAFAVALWGFGLLWLWVALGGVWVYVRPKRYGGDGGVVPFNLSWWSLIFPLGTMGLSSSRIAIVVPSGFFRVVAAVVSVMVFVAFMSVAMMTVWDLCTNKGGKVLQSAVAEELERRTERQERDADNAEENASNENRDNEEADAGTLRGTDSQDSHEDREDAASGQRGGRRRKDRTSDR